MKPAIGRQKYAMAQACRNYAQQQQCACGENTPEWIAWEKTVMYWERRLCMFELDDGPPKSIIRENV
jgi:hypothetical protein